MPERLQLSESGITTNMSERVNSLVKDLDGWTERPVDEIVLCFRLLCNFCEQEINIPV